MMAKTLRMRREAAYEARDYYTEASMTKKSNKNIMYWQGWIDCLGSIALASQKDFREWIYGYGGHGKGLYLAHYIALAVSHYEDAMNGKREPLTITEDSFSLFHESTDKEGRDGYDGAGLDGEEDGEDD